ncbi:MAG TPA: type II toxin-antitoxin system RelE/ParE family toxin [Candidatus Omnitrophica bacterium]|nr:type II toxin-antitoxin system RelE/ParE family toxin [Candidatus Omnitrophota bacterium]
MEHDRLSAIYYFVDERGNKPVEEFIRSLPKKERAKVFAYIVELKSQGNNLRRPVADYLKSGIYELRPKDDRIFYFFYLKNNAVLIHAIKKNIKEIPKNDLMLCIKRKKQIEDKHKYIQKLEL